MNLVLAIADGKCVVRAGRSSCVIAVASMGVDVIIVVTIVIVTIIVVDLVDVIHAAGNTCGLDLMQQRHCRW